MTGTISLNVAFCGHCGDFLRSRYRHHFTTCGCGALSLDGGQDYQRIIWDTGLPVQHVFLPDDASYWAQIHDIKGWI